MSSQSHKNHSTEVWVFKASKVIAAQFVLDFGTGSFVQQEENQFEAYCQVFSQTGESLQKALSKQSLQNIL